MTPRSILRTVIQLLILCLLANSCAKEEKKPGPYRFIDRLEKKNIITSPMIGLQKNFQWIEQEWTGKDFIPLTMNGKKFWTVSTRFPILGKNEAEKPEGMRLSLPGKEIEFSRNPKSNAFTWQWMKAKKEIIARKLYRSKRKNRGIVIYRKEVFETEVILPQGEVIFEIFVSSGNPESYSVHLDVFLDDERIGTLLVKNYKAYRLVKKANLGKHRLILSFRDSSPVLKKGRESIYLVNINLEALRDILLVSPPKGREPEEEGVFKASYYCEPVDNIITPPQAESSQYFQQEVTFAISGKRKIEILGQRACLDSSLTLWLDEEKIGTQRINDLEWSSYLFEPFVPKGRHELKIEGEMTLQAIIIENPQKETYLPLFELGDEAEMHDLGSGRNPYLLKKKLSIPVVTQAQTVSALFAPPKSIFEFKLELPEFPVLEFGYGLLKRAWEERGDGVNFVILLEEGGKERIIFSSYLNPYQEENQRKIIQEKIDLAGYQRKKVKLRFLTEGFPPGLGSSREFPDRRNDLSFWHNPVIYQSQDGREQVPDGLNVILISIDTLRADHLKCYGYEKQTSPQVDRLAQDGVLFEHAFSPSPWTLPSHVSMLTSLDSLQHGVNSTKSRIAKSTVTLAEILRVNDYFCSAFTEGGQVSARFGFSKGFDSYHETKGALYIQESVEHLFRRTDKWIDNNKDKLFFLFLHTYQVHGPYDPPPPYDQVFSKRKIQDKTKFFERVLGRRKNKFITVNDQEKEDIISLYDGGIRYTDEHLIKPLVKKLQKTGLYDRTAIIFTSDHGEEFYDHEGWTHSHSLYNELIRIPLIIKFPHSKFKAKRIENFVRLIDIVPTVLEELGLEVSDYGFNGNSLLKMIRGEGEGDRSFISYLGPEGFLHIPEKISMNKNRYKLILNSPYTKKTLSYFRPPPPPFQRIELYNLEEDPLESNNLALHLREIAQEMQIKLVEYLKKAREKKALERAFIDEELEERLRALGYIE
ncbi:MAG: sulfatase-like hydrolase/transferase [Candidatus Aminicenantes bacterium]|nr:sulfatase-like hydrolase/transferase [Candidatus Aminicenantes bacterium]